MSTRKRCKTGRPDGLQDDEMKMKRILSVLGLCCACVSPAQALDLHGLPPDALALWVAPVEGQGVTVRYRDESPVNPASTMKLLTSWVALERLGPDFTWKTQLVSDAPVVDGVLQGDVYWVGQGDPGFFSDKLNALLNGLRQRGIHRIAGRLILDDSAYSRLSSAEGFDSDGGESFMAPPDALLTNLNVVWLHFYNEAGHVRVAMDPPLAGMNLSTELSLGGAGECRDVRRYITVETSASRITVRGQLPPSCDGATTYLQPLAATAFSGAAFSGMWREMGGDGPVATVAGKAPATARVLSEVVSDPLGRILPDINKFSSNPMIRSLYLTLGRMAPVSGDTVADAESAVRQTLAAHHLSDAGLVLENGAGLSRTERVTARLLGETLREAARGPYASELLASLPVAGQSGTLKRRLTDLGPRLRLKTGTLNDVAALAGYWQAPNGQRLVIVALVQADEVTRYKPALDAVVRDAVQQYAASGI
jgi:D-alanyl-D-alanine carboxypeptidase/D-alanyl-D-alanine-endopeptidase (penicillin-binding protein 4)